MKGAPPNSERHLLLAATSKLPPPRPVANQSDEEWDTGLGWQHPSLLQWAHKTLAKNNPKSGEPRPDQSHSNLGSPRSFPPITHAEYSHNGMLVGICSLLRCHPILGYGRHHSPHLLIWRSFAAIRSVPLEDVSGPMEACLCKQEL